MSQAPREGDPGASSEAETLMPSQRQSLILGQDTKLYADTHTALHPTLSRGLRFRTPCGCLEPQRVLDAVQSPSRVQLFATPWTAARQASLSLTAPSLSRFMSIASAMPSSHLIL